MSVTCTIINTGNGYLVQRKKKVEFTLPWPSKFAPTTTSDYGGLWLLIISRITNEKMIEIQTMTKQNLLKITSIHKRQMLSNCS